MLPILQSMLELVKATSKIEHVAPKLFLLSLFVFYFVTSIACASDNPFSELCHNRTSSDPVVQLFKFANLSKPTEKC